MVLQLVPQEVAWGKDAGESEASQWAVPAILGNLRYSYTVGSHLGGQFVPGGHLLTSGDTFVATTRVCVCACVMHSVPGGWRPGMLLTPCRSQGSPTTENDPAQTLESPRWGNPGLDYAGHVLQLRGILVQLLSCDA